MPPATLRGSILFKISDKPRIQHNEGEFASEHPFHISTCLLHDNPSLSHFKPPLCRLRHHRRERGMFKSCFAAILKNIHEHGNVSLRIPPCALHSLRYFRDLRATQLHISKYVNIHLTRLNLHSTGCACAEEREVCFLCCFAAVSINICKSGNVPHCIPPVTAPATSWLPRPSVSNAPHIQILKINSNTFKPPLCRLRRHRGENCMAMPGFPFHYVPFLTPHTP